MNDGKKNKQERKKKRRCSGPCNLYSSKNAEHKIQRVHKISTNEIINQGRKWNLTTCEKCTK